jgi:hypothetical protein
VAQGDLAQDWRDRGAGISRIFYSGLAGVHPHLSELGAGGRDRRALALAGWCGEGVSPRIGDM